MHNECGRNITHFLNSFTYIGLDSIDENIAKTIKEAEDKRFSCGLLKIILSELLPPNLHKVITLDVDTVVLEDLGNLWSYFEHEKEGEGTSAMANKLIGSALEMDDVDSTEYKYFNDKLHIFPPSGLNTGVLLLNLKLFREKNVTGKYLLTVNDEPYKLADQDIINTFAYYHPKYICLIDCRWNKRVGSQCHGKDEVEYHRPDSGILHGNGAAFYNGKNWFARDTYEHYHQIYEDKLCRFKEEYGTKHDNNKHSTRFLSHPNSNR
jgi:lipopolysaccharide biosynthesis glycosyltransferase